jgi:RNA recognition motif-containing protein
MYMAFLTSAGYPYAAPAPAPPAPVPPAPVPQAQPPPGFVVPAGYKLVRAPGHVGPANEPPPLTPATDKKNARQDFDSTPDLVKTRPATASKSFNADGGKLFVGGLNAATTSDKLRAHFSQFGRLGDVSVIKDSTTKLSRGFAFVEFEDGIPASVFEADHMIDKRKCSVKPYTYAWK